MAEQEVIGKEAAFREQVLEWARGPRKMADWVRQNSAQLRKRGVDVRKYIFGQAVVMIKGDDEGCFFQPQMETDQVNQEWINLERDSLLERLDWESSLNEIPADLMEVAAKFKDRVEATPWIDHRTERKFFQDWKETVREFVLRKLEENPKEGEPNYSEAEDYYEKKRLKISELFSQESQAQKIFTG